MIKINPTRFDWTIIRAIYNDVAETILRDHSTTLYEKANSDDEIIKRLVRKWFFRDEELDKQKIIEFLLRPDTRTIIDEFWDIVGSVLCNDSKQGRFLSRWPTIQKRAIDETNKSKRKSLLTSVITETNVHLFSGITAEDLTITPKNCTVYSSQVRIKAIRFSELDHINSIKSSFKQEFDYDVFARSFRSRLIQAMHTTVCPYCNRQYITMYQKGDDLRASADLDHFFSQSDYPFLAISVYNLIPSCQICNSRLKGDIDFYAIPHINPYERGFDNTATFKIQDATLLLDSPDVRLKTGTFKYGLVLSRPDAEIENAIRTFCLNEHYQTHQDYVGELISKAKIYSEGQIKEYLEQFEGLFDSYEEFSGILFGNYLSQEDQGKRPLAKLTQDILTDIGWIKK